mgnify:CR=1 FL=1
MKRITISLCILGFALTAKAQVGVNTTNPRGIFNVDGSQNNTNTTVPATVVAESKDDVVVEAGGNVGIGTSDPTVKLEIQTGGIATAPVAGVKLVDGTQGAGKVLVSDANGVGTWQVNTGSQNSLYQNLKCSITSDFALTPVTVHSIPGIDPFTVSNAGKYELIFHSFFTNTGISEPKSFYIRIYVNGVLIKMEETYSYVPSGSYLNAHYPVIINIPSSSSTIEVKLQTSVSDLVIQSFAAVRNNLDVIFLGL